jgi:hypothetical protein
MKYLFLCIAALIGGMGLWAQPITVTLTAAKDNSIFQEIENSNGAGIGLFAGATAASNNGAPRRALVYFDLSGIPAGSTITDVTLQMYCTRARAVVAAVRLHKLNTSWGEGTSNAGNEFDGVGTAATTDDATWLTRQYNTVNWLTPGGDYSPTVSATTSIGTFDLFYSWNAAQMTADVQSWVNSPATNHGWIFIGEEAVLLSAKRFASRETPTPSLRPQLTVTYIGAVPVTLTGLTAKPRNGGVLLNWQTQQELNNAFFGIEHSTDGVSYTNIGRVNGAGTVSTAKAYQFLHPNADPGRHFYRLAQTDNDGKVNYSTVVQVVLRKTDASLVISPNPAVNSIQLGDAPYPANTLYTISNATGSTVLQGKLQGNRINIAALAAGTYLLKLQEPGQSPQHGRFVKQ